MLQDGDLVKLSRELTDDEREWITMPHGADGLIVEDFFEAGDREKDEIDVDFYYLHDAHGCTVVLPADALELVLTARDVATKGYPSVEQIRDAVSSELVSLDHYGSNFQAYETWKSGEGKVEVACRTETGLHFAFEVTVSKPWQIDG